MTSNDQRRIYCIKEKWFSLKGDMIIYDEQGQKVYTVYGKLLHFGLDMVLKDDKDSKVCEIRSKLSLTPEYSIYDVYDKKIGRLTKQFKLLKEVWHFEDLINNKKYDIIGNFFAYDWKIYSDANIISSIDRKHSIIKDCYGVSIEPKQDIVSILCIAICLEKYHHDMKINH